MVRKEGTPRGERELGAEISRRQFSRGVIVTGASSLLLGVSFEDLYGTVKKREKQYDEVVREVEAQGIPPTDQRALRTMKQIHNEHKTPTSLRNPKQVQQAKEIEVQQEIFKKAVRERVIEKRDKEGPSNARVWMGISGVNTGLITSVLGILLMSTSGYKNK